MPDGSDLVQSHLSSLVWLAVALGSAGLVAGVVAWVTQRNRSQALMRLLAEAGASDLPEVLSKLAADLTELEHKTARVNNDVRNLLQDQKGCLQRVGLVRFDAFNDVGGRQSFALGLLDADDNGVLLTSLFGREGARTYAKPLRAGESEVPLTDEEKLSLKQAREGEANSK